MAPADLGTDSGNGAAVPALPMHTDPVSIAVRPRSSTHLMLMCQLLGLTCRSVCTWSARASATSGQGPERV